MSFSQEQRKTIKYYMLEKISEKDSDFIAKTISAFAISKNTAYRYLRELMSENLVYKDGKAYWLVVRRLSFEIDVTQLTPEDDDKFFLRNIDNELADLKDNVRHIWYYCFTEMMNNIIDHSESTKAKIVFFKDAINTTIILSDNGIGIFNKIRNYYGFTSLDDAIIELFKGKLTTDKANHSGEGIFFSSRIMDLFAAISDGKIFSHTDYDELVSDLDAEKLTGDKFQTGTLIIMRLANETNKTIKEIMDQYSDADGAFVRTRIPIKNMYPTYPVSRSQAKRLTHRFDSFSEIELDFTGVNEIGQGFAHEVFVVYANKHPETALIPFNAGLSVQKMINHVVSSYPKTDSKPKEN